MSDSREAKPLQQPEKESPESVELSTRFALTLEEAAAAFSISLGHLRNHLSEVPHIYIGTRVVIPVKPTEEWLRDLADATKANSDQMAEEVLREIKKNQ